MPLPGLRFAMLFQFASRMIEFAEQRAALQQCLNRRVGSIHGIDERQTMSLPSRQRKVLAQTNSRRGRFDRLKLTARR